MHRVYKMTEEESHDTRMGARSFSTYIWR